MLSTHVYAECACPPHSVEENVRQADRIFRGQVVSANYQPTKSEFIEFVVQVDETIRGAPEKEFRLTTAMPQSCGVPVRLGFHDMFILRPDDQHVSSCSGSGRDKYHRFPFLREAIALVDYSVSEVRESVQLLNQRFHASFDRVTVEEFFELVTRIDPSGYAVTSYDDQIQYRNVVVYFKDGKFEKAGAL